MEEGMRVLRLVFISLLTAASGLFLTQLKADRIAPKEKVLKPLVSFDGQYSKITSGRFYRIESPQAWESLLKRHQSSSDKSKIVPTPMPLMDINFDRCMIIAIFAG